MASNIDYPTDADLLADGVRSITRILKRLREAGAAAPAKFRDCTRAVEAQILSIGKGLKWRTQKAQQATRQILQVARRVVAGAKAVAHQVGEALQDTGNAASGVVQRLTGRLRQVTDLTQRVMDQTREVLKGNRHVPD